MAEMFPITRPYKKGFLPVGQGHLLYFELCGNPKGKPVLFLHGGPGAGCGKKDRCFFNPKKFNAILFDQRGSGKSKPAGSLKGNNTKNLVEDIRKLLCHLGIKKVFLFGGSWGSALALCYSIKYPEKVAGMLLRGIFLCRKSDNDYIYWGPARQIFPEAFEKFIGTVPKSQRKSLERYYFKKINSSDKKTSRKFAQTFVDFENSVMYLKKPTEKRKKKRNPVQFAKIEAFFLANNCFLPENYILKNLHRIRKMPVTIVHGRYDLVCPPSAAAELHSKLPKSKLFFTLAGHASRDMETPGKLVEEMERAVKTIKW